MVGRHALGQVALGVGAIALAASCVPAKKLAGPVVSLDVGAPALAAAEPAAADPAVAAAATLLKRLELDVAPPDLPPFALPGDPASAPAASPAVPTPSFLAAARSVDDAARATECMTAAIYYEARSEPLDGQRAVAQVVMNRVRDRAFPSSVCGVVWQGSQRSTGCQFSFTCDGSLNRPRDPYSWARARQVAVQALSGEGYAPVGSATHYHTNAILPWWAPSLRRIGAVGSHIFYRWAAPLERALAFRQTYAGVEPGAGRPTVQPIDAPTLAQLPVTVPGSEPLAQATPAANAPAPTRVATSRSERGVTVHRGGAPAPGTVAALAPSSSESSGVRVHRGGGAPMTGVQ